MAFCSLPLNLVVNLAPQAEDVVAVVVAAHP
jgi:hypothetical protein